MRTYLVDTSTWMEFFAGSAKGLRARDYMFRAKALVTHTLVVAELRKVYLQHRRSYEEFETDLGKIKTMASVVEDLPESTAREAGRVHANPPNEHMGVVDCILLAYARGQRGWKVLSCDRHFDGVKEALYIGGP